MNVTKQYSYPPKRKLEDLPACFMSLREWRMFFNEVMNLPDNKAFLIEAEDHKRECRNIARYSRRLNYPISVHQSDGKLYVTRSDRERKLVRPRFTKSAEVSISQRASQ